MRAEVPAAKRAVIHREVGEAIESLHPDEIDAHIGQLAHHYLEAGSAVDTARAVEYAAMAAERAAQRLAHEDAASFYARALEALDLSAAARDLAWAPRVEFAAAVAAYRDWLDASGT